jgi:quinol-cytochrome oxidoreductase complex cytochrome b subunit
MPETSSCIANRCFHSVEGVVATCPRCGSPMWPSPRWRARGWVLLVNGLLLTALTVAVLWYLVGLYRAYEAETDSDASDSAFGMLIFFGSVGLFLVVGLASAVAGARQIATGRRNRTGAMIVFWLLAAFFIVMSVLMIVSGGDAPHPVPRIR